MKFLDKNSLLGLGWILLVGTGASLADRAGHGVSVWAALVVATIGWQAIAVFSAKQAARNAANQQDSKREERDLLEEFHRLLNECSTQFSAQGSDLVVGGDRQPDRELHQHAGTYAPAARRDRYRNPGQR